MRCLVTLLLVLTAGSVLAIGKNDPVTPIDVNDIFVSDSFIVKRAPSVGEFDICGVTVTTGAGANYSGISGVLTGALVKMLAGKTSISLVPKKFIDFVHINPDVIIKSLPFAHYFSYIFDITSYLEVKSGDPTTRDIAPFKYHIGNPETNVNVKELEKLMLVRFQKLNELAGADALYAYKLPDGTLIRGDTYGMSEVLFHISSTYWAPIIERLKVWWKGRMEEIVEGNEERILRSMEQAGSDLTVEQMMTFLDSEEGTNVFWEIFKEFKGGVTRSGKDIKELLEILNDVAFVETVVDGLGKNGVKGASLVFKIGDVLPYPNLEMLLQLLKDIINKIKSIPKMHLGWPKNDVRMAMVTRYLNEQVVEISKIIVTPSSVANDWYPVFLATDWHREVQTLDGERVGAEGPVALGHYGRLMQVTP